METRNISKLIAGIGASIITGALVMNLDTTIASNSKDGVKKELKTQSGSMISKTKSGTLNPAIAKKITLANLKLKKKLTTKSGALAGSGKLKELPKFGSGILSGSGMFDKKPKFGSGELQRRENFGSGFEFKEKRNEIKYDTRSSAS